MSVALEWRIEYRAPRSLWVAFRRGFLRGLLIAIRGLREIDMGPDDIAEGVRRGWLVADPDGDGWYRFVYDFKQDRNGRWVRLPANSVRRVRIVVQENERG